MASETEAKDVESLQKIAPRVRWLDCCLVLSVIILFMGVAALVAAVLVLHKPQSKQHTGFEMANIMGSPSVKMQTFTYLKATSSELKNCTMLWSESSDLSVESLRSNYEFNPVQHSLQVKKRGSYFMFLELNVSCSSTCHGGFFTVVVPGLNCNVDLPHSSSSQPKPTVQKRCWTVKNLTMGMELLFQMFLPHDTLRNWTLESEGTGFGMFLVS